MILDIINRPLEETAFEDKATSKDPFERTAAFQAQLRKSALASARAFDALAAEAEDAATRRAYRGPGRAEPRRGALGAAARRRGGR